MKTTTKYDDIIHLSHHVSKSRPQMPIADRAAQFSPFAALTGHEAAIQETARVTDKKIELDEHKKNLLNEKLLLITENLQRMQKVQITYFLPDERKKGGAYIQVEDCVKKIDDYQRMVIMEDGLKIRIDDIYDIIMG